MPALRHRAAHFLLSRLGFFRRSYRERAFGRDFVIPIINGRKTYVHEEWMAEVIARLLAVTPGGFIDVGVNLGQTMLKVAAIDASRRYVGFEPNPACADYASELSLANNLGYVVVPAGLGSTTTVASLQLFREDATDPSASLIHGFRKHTVGSKAVVIVSIDNLPADLLPERTAIVKIDVEGSEAEVIEAIEPLLTSQRPYVLVEVLPAYSEEHPDRIAKQTRLEEALRRCDYRIFRIHRDRADRVKGLEAIDSIGIHGDMSLCDYLMVPDEKADRISEIVAPLM